MAESSLLQASNARRSRDALSYFADVLIFLSTMLTLGVFEPQLDIVALNSKSLTSVVAATSNSSLSSATLMFTSQLASIALAIVACLLMLRDHKQVLRTVRVIWPLLVFFGYFVLSTVWSDHPEFALRRSLGLVASTFVIIVAASFVSFQRTVLIVYVGYWVSLILNIAATMWPAAGFDQAGLFRGTTGEKNTLGAIAACGIILGLTTISCVRSVWAKALALLFIVLWAAALAATVSKTSITLAILVPVTFAIFDVVSRLLRINFGLTTLGIVLSLSTSTALACDISGHSLFEFVEMLGGDSTFTNRTPIWNLMLEQINDRILAGHGFASVWGVGYDARNLQSPWSFIRLINSGHNGYLDILATLGVIGLGLYAIIVMHFGAAAERLRVGNPPAFRFVWFIMIFFLLHNTMESTIAVSFDPIWQVSLIAILIAARETASHLVVSY
jgi:exopolysaccharide production protein ExoQ